MLAGLPVVVAGCHGSAPESSPNDRGLGKAVVKGSAPESVSSDRDAVEAAARGFLSATKERHPEKAEAFLTAKARTQFAKSAGVDRNAGRLLGATYQLGEPTITGDTADIPVTVREAGKEQKMGLKLRRMDGKWGIFALSGRIIPDDPDSEIVMNFEEPESTSRQLFGGKLEDIAKEWQKGMKESIDRAQKDFVEGNPGPGDLAVEALEAISRDQFNASWKVDFNSKGRPAGEVLRDLARLVGRSLETTPIQDRALAKPLAVEVRGFSRLQAIDEVTRSAGLSPIDSTPVISFGGSPTGENSVQKTMELRPRRGRRLVAFAGPFMVEVIDVREAVPYATAILTLKRNASGLTPMVLNDLKSGNRETFAVTDVLDAKGRSLVDTEAAASPSITASWGAPVPGEYEWNTRLALKGLLRDVSNIKTLRCKLSVTLPARVETIRFDRLVPGETRKVGDLEITLKAAQKGQASFNGTPVETWHFEMEFCHKTPDRAKSFSPDKTGRLVLETIGPARVKFVGRDVRGRPLKMIGGGTSRSDPSSWTAALGIQGPATSLVVKVIADVDVLVYDFVLEDIPLASHASMPERIEPARFPGHASPVAVEFLAIGGTAPFQTAQLRVTNRSDKDIRMLGMKLDYLAPDGRRLGGWDRQDQWGTPRRPGTAAGEPNPILVAKGSKREFEINAPFLTQGTKTIAVAVRTVGFADAETWTAPGLKK
jgi:hypothetical protein